MTTFAQLSLAGLHGLDQDQANRLCVLLVLHLEIDRGLSWRLHMAARGNPTDETAIPSADELRALQRQTFADRFKAAVDAGIVIAEHELAIRALNLVRNDLVHVRLGERRLHVNPAISRPATFDALYDSVARACDALYEPIVKLLRAPGPGEGWEDV